MQARGREEGHDASATRSEDVCHAPEAFAEAYVRFAPLLRKIATKKFHVPVSDADALVHDVFATYFTNPAEVITVESYLVGAICNACRHYWRRADAADALFCSDVPCAATATDEILEGIARRRLLTKILMRIGPRCRDILFRYYMNGETTRAIADALHIKAPTVLVLLSRCRKRALSVYRVLVERVYGSRS